MALNQPFNLCLQWLRSMEWRPAENLCFSVASWLFYHYSCTEQVCLMVLRKCCSVVLDCLGAVLMIWLLLQSRLKQKTLSILHWHPEEQQSMYGLTDLYTHTLPARLNMTLNKTRGIHRRSDPGWQTSPVMVRESIRQNHLTEWVGPLQQQKTVSHFSVHLSTCWSLWSQVDVTLEYLSTYYHAPALKGTEMMTYFQEQWGHKKPEWYPFIAVWLLPSSWKQVLTCRTP